MKEIFKQQPDLVRVKVGDRIPTEESRKKKLQEGQMDLESEKIEMQALEEFSEITQEEAETILEHVEVHGSEFKGKQLTAVELESAGQVPKYAAEIGGRRVFLSAEPYKFKKRRCITIYVESDDRNAFIPRTYYLSGSSANWRYLPEYVINQVDEISYFGKGYDEQSLNAPLAVQKKLAEISGEDDPIAEPDDVDFIFAGTARMMRYGNNIDQSYYQSVESAPIDIPGNFHLPVDDKNWDPTKTIYGFITKEKPEKIAFDQDKNEPDFSRIIDSWRQYSDQYGDITVRVYESKDGKCRYSFGTDSLGRSWMMGGETSDEVGVNGLRKKWPNLYDLFTPAFEYAEQTGGFGADELRNSSYVDMYAKYISKIPLIRKFEASIK